MLSRIETGARLITLNCCPGGTGKTRLALETASTLVPVGSTSSFPRAALDWEQAVDHALASID